MFPLQAELSFWFFSFVETISLERTSSRYTTVIGLAYFIDIALKSKEMDLSFPEKQMMIFVVNDKIFF